IETMMMDYDEECGHQECRKCGNELERKEIFETVKSVPSANADMGVNTDTIAASPLVPALVAVTKVMTAGMASHPHNDWMRQPALHHLARAERHLRLLGLNDQSEDHLGHAACRLLMALALRELEK